MFLACDTLDFDEAAATLAAAETDDIDIEKTPAKLPCPEMRKLRAPSLADIFGQPEEPPAKPKADPPRPVETKATAATSGDLLQELAFNVEGKSCDMDMDALLDAPSKCGPQRPQPPVLSQLLQPSVPAPIDPLPQPVPAIPTRKKDPPA